MIFLLIIQSLLIRSSLGFQSNNVCNTFQDYFHPNNNPNCFYNADMLLETPDLIRKYVGKVETHEITTEDGYILKVFRLPHANAKETVLLQHPLGSNSRVYVSQGFDSLGLYLWREGYDVWLNNQRGTQYSERHVNRSITQKEYWDFSFDEIGTYDIPAQIKLIKRTIGDRKIIFIGHSLGTTTGLVYAASKPEDARNSIKVFIFLATSAYYRFSTSPIAILAKFTTIIQNLVEKLQLGPVFPFLPVLVNISRVLFRIFPNTLNFLNLFSSVLTGWTPEEGDPTVVNFDIAINLKNAPWRILVHYLQLMNTKTRFQKFDHGAKQNIRLYGQKTPPEYSFANVSTPILMMSSLNDIMTTPQDADLLLKTFPKSAQSEHWIVSGLNHDDFQLGKSRKEKVFNRILQFLNKN